MAAYPDTVILTLCERFHLERGFLLQCLEESAVEIQEAEGRWELSNGTALQLRRIERLCHTLNVDVPAAALILELTHRVAALENELAALRAFIQEKR